MDYDVMLAMEGLSTKGEPGPIKPRAVEFAVADLNGDGKDELFTTWMDNSTSGFEHYVAIFGWKWNYQYLCTLPRFDPPEAVGTAIPPTGIEKKLSFKDRDTGKTKYVPATNCTHIILRDVDGDGTKEIVCAHMIWRLEVSPQGWVTESHFDKHSYVIRVLEMSGNSLVPDMFWNDGQPLFIPEKLPSYNFQFTSDIINRGLHRN